ncbi:TonB-linked SusC/RagA family outer membrane protein [Chitinophaga niastensis]|uniref:TonB-linked SusC/RagA family outer membrane protein n=1 Tax=Chitinophaga niastensis TaxID=536980 RepID=A0A2P8HVS6_CHINA|nr:TonB-dependent receptor [Chitinophaga niastensis]PSL50329.1 TonB-linked SusC/RagA family outer membrane protein [Chitinophaga niastensis]
MKKILPSILIPVLLLFATVSWAQNKTVTGKVTDETGAPVPGASIAGKVSKAAVAADANGVFKIAVAPGEKTLTVTALGYTQQEVPVSDAPVTIRLSSSSKELSEVIVVGYGTQKITKVSGAISTIKGTDIANLRPVRLEEALQGRASGVNVIQSGSPGAKPTVLIRGIPSFTGTDPVVIIDGIPQTLDDLNAINAADIESLNVLKDAATTAIYGVKGGNGVIVVTTRSGKKNQKPEITVNANYGVQEVLKTIGVLNATEYGGIINEGSVAAGGNLIFPDISKLGAGTDWQKEIFHKAPMQNYNVGARGGSEKMTYFIAAGYLGQDGIVGGGSKSNFNRINGTANIGIDLAPKLKLILNTSYVNIRSKGIRENSFNSIIGSALNFDPTVPVLNSVPNTVGKYGFSDLLRSEIFNPLTKLDNTYQTSNGNKLYGKAELQYDILKNLKLTSRFGYTNWDETGKSFIPLVFYGPLNVENTMNADGATVVTKNDLGGISSSAHNSVTEYKKSNFSFTAETFANYNFNIKKDHHFETVAGFSMAKSTYNGLTATAQDVPFNSWTFADLTAATGTNSAGVVYYRDTIINGVAQQVRDKSGDVAPNLNARNMNKDRGFRKNLSYFGRINYDYKDKYLASFTARRDGSYAFGPDNKFADFYSGSLGWIISSEDFFHSNFINYLKIRGSYGTVGNENVNPPSIQVITGGPNYDNANNNGYTFGNSFLPGSTIGSYQNLALSWEKQKQSNVGFDITFFKNKFSLTADYFQKEVSGLLFTPSVSLYLGTAKVPDANIGATKSSGVDMSLGYTDKIANKLSISTSITFTSSKNMVTGTNTDNTAVINGGNYFNGQSQTVTRFEKGQIPGYFYGYKTDGLFQSVADIAKAPKQDGAQPGDIRFVDVNGDGVINDKDKTMIGNPFPKFTMGWNLFLGYKSFDLNIFTYASVGNDVYRAYERNANYTNKFRDVLDRWTGPGSTNNARHPRYSFTDGNSNIRVSDRYVEDGSFIKLKNIQLGYTLPASVFQHAGFRQVRVYVQVKNAYTFTRYSGYDPEIAGGILDTGVDRGAYPQARTWSFGIDFKL